MDNNYFFIHRNFERKDRISGKVEKIEFKFSTEFEISDECKEIYKNAIDQFINDYKSNDDIKCADIFYLSKYIKLIFLGVWERELTITIEKEIGDGSSCEHVRYQDGLMTEYSFHNREWDDKLIVSLSPKGTNIQYKKDRLYVSKKKDISRINSNIDVYLNKIYDLQKLNYDYRGEYRKNYCGAKTRSRKKKISLGNGDK